MSGTPANTDPKSRPVSARARLRPKSQLTLPEEIRRALRVNEGDEIEFQVRGNGVITIRGFMSVPTDDAWLYAPREGTGRVMGHRPGEGRSTVHESAEALFAHLNALGAAGP